MSTGLLIYLNFRIQEFAHNRGHDDDQAKRSGKGKKYGKGIVQPYSCFSELSLIIFLMTRWFSFSVL